MKRIDRRHHRGEQADHHPDGDCRPEHRAEHERELHVAHAHPTRSHQCDREEEAGGAKRGEDPLRARIDRRLRREDDDEGRQDDAVRNDPELDVRRRNGDEDEAEERCDERLGVEPELPARSRRRAAPTRARRPDSATESPLCSCGNARAEEARRRTGTLSRQPISWPQLMQAEPGETSERRSGTRAATTFMKLPSARPGANANAASAKSISRPPAVLRRSVGGLAARLPSPPPRRRPLQPPRRGEPASLRARA